MKHALIGQYKGCYECHIRPDLHLIYSYEEDVLVVGIRFGKHSNVFKKNKR